MPANQKTLEIATNGSMTLGTCQYDGLQQKNSIVIKGGKLAVDKLDQPQAPKFQIFTCNVPDSRFPLPPEKGVFNISTPNGARLSGQLGTEDHRSCLTVKNGTVTLEDCAKKDGDQLASQWMYFFDNIVVHGNSSALKGDVSLKGDTLDSMKSIAGKTEFGCLLLGTRQLDDQLDKPSGSRGTFDRRTELVLTAMEDCAKEDGDQLAAQWLHLVGNRLVFAGKAGSPLEAEVKMDGEKVKRFADQGLKDSYNVLFLENTPMDGQEAQKPLGGGDSVQEKSESSAGQSRSFSVLFTAAVLSVAAWMVGPIC